MDNREAQCLHDRPRMSDSHKPWGLLLLLMAMTAIGPTTLNILVPALPRLQTGNRSSENVLQPSLGGISAAACTRDSLHGVPT